jgi:hypothetical protein
MGRARLGMRTAAALVFCVGLFSTGCDKLKGAMSKGDAGASESSSGGLLSFLGTDFEGELSANMTSKTQKGGPSQLVFGIKKPKYRIDMTGNAAAGAAPQLAQGGSVILDPPQKKGWVLVPPQKMAMVIDFDKAKAMAKSGGPFPGAPGAAKGAPSAPAQPPKIDKTGKKDTVAGYTCDIWNITSEGKKVEACVAEGITWIDLTDLGFGSPEFAVAAFATEANRFPLRVIAYDAAGAEETRMEVTKVDKKKLDDARFVVPADYRVIDMAAMMTGLGNVPNMPNIPHGAVPPPRPHH